MNCHDTIIHVLTTIEQREETLLTIGQLSRECFLSPSHLQKLFRLTTGQSLIAYARSRKLAHSLDDLYHSDYRIIDIALKYGFQHEQSYIRAFQKEFGYTPGQAREQCQILPVRERITPESLSESGQGILCAPQTVIVPAFYVVGRSFYFEDFDDERDALTPNILGNQFYQNDIPVIPNAVSKDVYFGLVMLDEKGGTTYMPSIQVKDLSAIPPGLTGRMIPEHLCLSFRYVGHHHFTEINMHTADSIYRTQSLFWTTQTRYRILGGFFFEKIDSALYDGEFCQMEIIVPVEYAAE